MATQKETIEFILDKLKSPRFGARKMFGEYALYADGKVVGLVCDDMLFMKILPATDPLKNICEKGPPYPGAKPHYIVEEAQLETMEDLPIIFFRLAASLPVQKKKKKKV